MSVSYDDRYHELAAKVIGECMKYGLEGMAGGDPVRLFDVLMGHLYANHEMTNAMNVKSIELLQERLAKLRVELDEAGIEWR